jgi:cell division septation protein DedD
MQYLKKHWYLVIITLLTIGVAVMVLLTSGKLSQTKQVAPTVPQQEPRAAAAACTVQFTVVISTGTPPPPLPTTPAICYRTCTVDTDCQPPSRENATTALFCRQRPCPAGQNCIDLYQTVCLNPNCPESTTCICGPTPTPTKTPTPKITSTPAPPTAKTPTPTPCTGICITPTPKPTKTPTLTPTPAGGGGETPTPTTAPQCIAMKFYKTGVPLSDADLATLQSGDTITLALTPSGAATKARFRVSGGSWNETTTRNSNGEFVWDWTIPSGATTFTIDGELFNGTIWY